MDTKKLLILVGTIAFIMLAAALAIATATSQQPQTSPNPITRYTGNLACLPHKNANPGQPQTLECAIGLKTIEGTHFALKDMPKESEYIEFSTSITLTGDVEKPAADEKYDITGTLKVKTFEVNN